jgi:methionyl-tRNA formyltransferase
VDRLVRACTPAPGAWTTWQGERLGLGPVEPAGPTNLAPGQVRVGRREVLVGAGDGQAVRLGEVRPAGKRPMAGDAWARGARDLDGGTLA